MILSVMNQKNVCIFSAHLSDCDSTENARRSADLINELIDTVGFSGVVIPCDGQWEDKYEQAYCVISDDLVVLSRCAVLALRKGQEQVIMGFLGAYYAFDLHTAEYSEEKIPIPHNTKPRGDHTKILDDYVVFL